MKMLYILNVANRVNNFCMSSLIAAKKMNIEYHIAGNWGYANDSERIADEKKYGIRIYQIDFIRSPLDIRNYKAYEQLKELVSSEKYDVIHCNTPIGGVLGRLVGKKCKVKTVIYQAHGFHFFKGAPKLNWMIYYPIEKWLAHNTDAMITINHEDYALAQKKMKLRDGGKVYFVPGVGIQTAQYAPDEAVRQAKRQGLGLAEDDVMLISAGELNANKNNAVIISALAKLRNSKIHYFLCGVGELESDLRRQAEEAGISANVHFLGYRRDMKELLHAADVFVLPSYREGLARSIMEAMSSGLPCVVSNIRGNVDLVENKENGFTCTVDNATSFAGAIEKLADEPDLRKAIRRKNLEKIKGFDSSLVERDIQRIYTEVCGGGEDIK